MKIFSLLVICLIIILVGIFFIACGINQFQPQNYTESGEEWTFERGIEYLEWAKSSHVYYANHPELCNATSGDVEWNKKITSEYQQLINWLKDIKTKR